MSVVDDVGVGATFHVVAVPPDRDNDPVRTFNRFTGDLHALADWLKSVGITTIAMESTSVYGYRSGKRDPNDGNLRVVSPYRRHESSGGEERWRSNHWPD